MIRVNLSRFRGLRRALRRLDGVRSHVEKFCPACGKGYGQEHEFCEVDGEKLVMINEEPSLIGRVL